MKSNKIGVLITALLICVSIVSCGKGGNTPVDMFVDVLDHATKQIEQINSETEFLEAERIFSPEEAWNILQDNADYILTDKDKEKIKKSYDKLLETAYEKSIAYSGLPQSLTEQYRSEIQFITVKANEKIENSNTLGDLSGL